VLGYVGLMYNVYCICDSLLLMPVIDVSVALTANPSKSFVDVNSCHYYHPVLTLWRGRGEVD